MDGDFAVVQRGFGFVVAGLQMLVVVLLDLGDVVVYFLAVQ